MVVLGSNALQHAVHGGASSGDASRAGRSFFENSDSSESETDSESDASEEEADAVAAGSDGGDAGARVVDGQAADPRAVQDAERAAARMMAKLLFLSVVTGHTLAVREAREQQALQQQQSGEALAPAADPTVDKRHLRHGGHRKNSKTRPLTLRDHVYLTLSDPDHSWLAHKVALLLLLTVLLSITSFVMQSALSLKRWLPVFERIEYGVVALFTADYVVRLATVRRRWRFVREPLNVVDAVSCMPLYVELLLRAAGAAADGPNARAANVVRLARLFRLLKFVSRVEKLQLVMQAIADSSDMVVMLVTLLGLATVLFSTLMYICESGTPEGGTVFTSIPATFWWCLVTLMTVGYGDMVPTTSLGKMVAGITMVTAFIILALPISVVGANFTQQWIVYKEAEQLQQRSAGLGPRLTKLSDELRLHNAVLAELLDGVVAVEEEMRASLAALRRGTAALRGAVNGGEGVSDELRASLAAAVAALDGQQDTVEELFALAELVSSDEFSGRLDGAVAKHTRVRGMAQRVLAAVHGAEGLLADVADFQAPRGHGGLGRASTLSTLARSSTLSKLPRNDSDGLGGGGGGSGAPGGGEGGLRAAAAAVARRREHAPS